jgi:hypothetical protein
MTGDDGLEGINPLLATAVEAFTRATADAFLKVWTGPRAADTMDGFLSGEVVFVVRLGELQVLAADRVNPRDPPPLGGYLLAWCCPGVAVRPGRA